MRITGGKFSGLALASLGKGDPGAHLRPTTDRVRESLFSILTHGPFGDALSDARVLDLFAGSGALGFEALSRGAAQCLFVEQEADAIKAIRANVTALDARSRTTVQQASVMSLGPAKAAHDLIILDPPYFTGAANVALDKMTRLGWIGPATLVAVETAKTEDVEVKRLEVITERRVGKAKLSLLKIATDTASS